VPEKENPFALPSREARPINHVGLFSQDRGKQFRVLLRIIFKVGILDEDDVPSRMGKACAQGRSFALVPVMEKNFADSSSSVILKDFPRTVRGKIVDDDDLPGKSFGQGSFLNAGDNLADCGRFVKNGNYNRQSLHGSFYNKEGSCVVK
jgi:hypothetical protein